MTWVDLTCWCLSLGPCLALNWNSASPSAQACIRSAAAICEALKTLQSSFLEHVRKTEHNHEFRFQANNVLGNFQLWFIWLVDTAALTSAPGCRANGDVTDRAYGIGAAVIVKRKLN